jgi:hypothetical protein
MLDKNILDKLIKYIQEEFKHEKIDNSSVKELKITFKQDKNILHIENFYHYCDIDANDFCFDYKKNFESRKSEYKKEEQEKLDGLYEDLCDFVYKFLETKEINIDNIHIDLN